MNFQLNGSAIMLNPNFRTLPSCSIFMIPVDYHIFLLEVFSIDIIDCCRDILGWNSLFSIKSMAFYLKKPFAPLYFHLLAVTGYCSTGFFTLIYLNILYVMRSQHFSGEIQDKCGMHSKYGT